RARSPQRSDVTLQAHPGLELMFARHDAARVRDREPQRSQSGVADRVAVVGVGPPRQPRVMPPDRDECARVTAPVRLEESPRLFVERPEAPSSERLPGVHRRSSYAALGGPPARAIAAAP